MSRSGFCMMKVSTCRGILACTLLGSCMIFWIGYSTILCAMSMPLRISSQLESLTNKLCLPAHKPVEKSFSNVSIENKVLGLVTRLQMNEEKLRNVNPITRRCRLPESLSKSVVSGDASVRCKRLEPLQASCSSVNHTVVCHQEHQHICQIEVNPLMPTVPSVLCHDVCESQPHLGIYNGTTGQVTWIAVSTVTQLQSRVLHLINPLATVQHPTRFCLIKCNMTKSKKPLTQLLVLPPSLQYLNTVKGQDQTGKINYNLIVLDGVSRNQFWSILPETVKKLKKIQVPDSELKVFDFEFMQDVADIDSLVNNSEGGAQLFQAGISSGYQTLWLKDGCWHHHTQYGTKGSNITYQTVQSHLTKVGVTDAGPLQPLCHSQAHDELLMPCFNGLPQYKYSLQYLQYYQAALGKYKVPYISVYKPRLGDSGTLLSSMDDSLAKYMEFSARQQNTITIIISSHHKNITDKPHDVEGSQQLFHPVMFLILPPSAQDNLETSHLSELINNQKQLVTALDMFDSMKYTMNYYDTFNVKNTKTAKPMGLLQAIDSNRSCSDLQLKSSISCVCAGYEVSVLNDVHVTLLAEYVVSQLNGMLQRQVDVGALYLREIGLPWSVVSTCHRLVGLTVLNATQALVKNNLVLTRMKIQVKTRPSILPQTSRRNSNTSSNETPRTATFQVIVQHNRTVDPVSWSVNMRLVSYKRVGSYRKYTVCTGGLLSAALCLCHPVIDKISPHPLNNTPFIEISKSNVSHSLHREVYRYYDPQILINQTWHQFGVKTIIHDVDPNAHKKCLYVIYRTHEAGGEFEAVNVCHDRVFTVGFSLTGRSLCYSSSLAVSHLVTPLSVHHIVTVMKHKNHGFWSWKYQVEFYGHDL